MEDLQFSASDKDDDELEEVTASSHIEVDANYDPEAEFLSYGTRKDRPDEDINDDLQVSESEAKSAKIPQGNVTPVPARLATMTRTAMAASGSDEHCRHL